MPKIKATAGQIAINALLPPELRDYNRLITKSSLKNIMQQVAEKYPHLYKDIGYKLKHFGDQQSLYSFEPLKYEDVKATVNVQPYLNEAEKQRAKLEKTLGSKEYALIDAYSNIKDKLNRDALAAGIKNNNALAEMVASGSRGKPAQFTDTTAAPLLVSDYKNQPIPIILDRSYGKGLTVPQYWAASYGTRRGMISAKLAVPLSGHMSKMLGWTTNNVIITQEDCMTSNGIARDTSSPDSIGKLLAKSYSKYPKNTIITPEILTDLKSKKITSIVVRNPATCETKNGMCSKCLGITEYNKLAEVGYNAGINTSAAMSEPLSQGMFNEKHTGGAVKKRVGGFPLIKRLTEVPKTFPDKAVLSEVHGQVTDVKELPWGGFKILVNNEEHISGQNEKPLVKPGQKVEKGEQLTDGIINPADLTRLRGIGEGRKYLSDALKDAFSEMGINLDRTHYDIAARSFINFGKVSGDNSIGDLLPGDTAFIDNIQAQIKPTKVEYIKINMKEKIPLGKYLAKPYLHYSIGTELTESVKNDLFKHGYTNLEIHNEKMPIEPSMIRVEDTASVDSDWIQGLGSQGLKKRLLTAIQKGHKSSIKGTKFIHPYIYGIGFGKNKYY